MKGEISAFINTNGGLIRSGVVLYHNLIASDFVRKVIETFATRIFLIGFGLVTSVIVARILEPEGRGLLGVATTITGIGVQFGNMGLHASNTYYVAKDRTILSPLFGNTLVISFAFGGLFSLLAGIIFQFFPNIAPLKGMLLVLSLLSIPFGLAYLLMQNLLIGIHEIRAYNKIEIANSIIPVLLMGGLIVVGGVTAETVYLVGFVSLVSALWWIFYLLKSRLRDSIMVSLTLFKENLQYGFKAYIAALFAYLVLRVDLLMIKYMLGAEQAGYYSIAVSMADMIYLLSAVIGTILFPKLSALSKDSERWNLTKKVSIALAVILSLLIAGSVLVAEPLVHILFGVAFLPAVPAFVWLMPGIFLLSVNSIFMTYFASIGMPRITVYSPGIALILNLFMNMALIPLWGIIGASVSSTISYGAMLAISLLHIFYLQKKGLY